MHQWSCEGVRWRPSSHQQLKYKILERNIGFLHHLAIVYDIIFPVLKGFHLTLSSPLSNRDDEGCKLNDSQCIDHLEIQVEEGKLSREEADRMYNWVEGTITPSPETYITSVPMFISSLKALPSIFEVDKHPLIVSRLIVAICWSIDL